MALLAELTDRGIPIISAPFYDGLLSSPLKNLFEYANYKALEGRGAHPQLPNIDRHRFILGESSADRHRRVET